MSNLFNVDWKNDNYQPLSPYKFLTHKDRLIQFQQGYRCVKPVTTHVVPTLRCNQRCYFCTYGQYKENGNNGNLQMEFSDLERYIHQLASVGVKGVIFTGGGEPTMYPDLSRAMLLAKQCGIDVALNSNGSRGDDELIEGILKTNPKYIRISLNNGSPITQQLVTGRDNYDAVLNNIEKYCEVKTRISPDTDISVGFVVNVVNYHEILDFVEDMLKIEEKIRVSTRVDQPIYSLQFRPVSNFEHSKHTANTDRINKLLSYIQNKYSEEDHKNLDEFLNQGAQTSPRVMRTALEQLKGEVSTLIEKRESRIKIIYPEQKFIDLIKSSKKPYSVCMSSPWYLFIWPDGNVYSCVEWAGNEEFAIGNLQQDDLNTILSGEQRMQVYKKINEEIIQNECVPVCAHHEMNILLNQIYNDKKAQGIKIPDNGQPFIRHENFL